MGKGILVIDDEPCIRQVLEIHLTEAGYDVACAGSGREGLRMLGEGRFDLAICDFSLPDMDGIELIIAIKSLAVAVPVLVISGFLDDSNEIKVVGSGALGYLRKPFLKEELLSIVAAVV